MDSPKVVSSDLYFLSYSCDVVKCGTYLFADRQITTKEDALQLQSDINSLQQLPEKKNTQKNVMSWHWENFITLPTLRSTPFHQQELEHVFEQKDLGVILHAELKFDEHLPVKVKKANAIAGLIRRTFLYLDGTLLKKLFTTFVRPHLEYGQVIWKQHLEKYMTILENVQHRATKLVDSFYHMSYSQRLKKLNLPLLVYRRPRGDMIEIFKHFYSYDICMLPENFRPQNHPSRKHDYQLVWKAPKAGVRGLHANLFYLRMIKT